MARTKKKVKPTIEKVDYSNDDGTVDEWVFDTSHTPKRAIQVTVDIRRRKSKSS